MVNGVTVPYLVSSGAFKTVATGGIGGGGVTGGSVVACATGAAAPGKPAPNDAIPVGTAAATEVPYPVAAGGGGVCITGAVGVSCSALPMYSGS